MADIQLKGAKAQAEMSKAKKTMSEADMKDLEFLRKQQGVEFREEIAKNAAKAQADIDKESAKQTMDYLKQSRLKDAEYDYNLVNQQNQQPTSNNTQQ
jgi:hypothetical protein